MSKLNELLMLLFKSDLEFIVVGEMACVIHGTKPAAEKLEIALLMSLKI